MILFFVQALTRSTVQLGMEHIFKYLTEQIMEHLFGKPIVDIHQIVSILEQYLCSLFKILREFMALIITSYLEVELYRTLPFAD